jgi:urea transport system ATP-binding protein
MMLLTRQSLDRAAEPPPGVPLLGVEHVRLSYGESVVAEDLSLAAFPGQVVCVMGRNAAGKTTLLKAIIGTLRVRGGAVRLAGTDVTRMPAYTRARGGIGYVPQGRGIFPFLSVYENLLIGLEPLGGHENGQLEEVYAIFPVLKEMAGRTAGLLSGGQQQQLAIGRALMGRPRLLLLDEPTEGIQPSIVQLIEDVIRALRGTITILLVEQFIDFALSVADRCYVMETGRIVLEGAPADLDQRTLHEYLAV